MPCYDGRVRACEVALENKVQELTRLLCEAGDIHRKNNCQYFYKDPTYPSKELSEWWEDHRRYDEDKLTSAKRAFGQYLYDLTVLKGTVEVERDEEKSRYYIRYVPEEDYIVNGNRLYITDEMLKGSSLSTVKSLVDQKLSQQYHEAEKIRRMLTECD
jgi:hypothetical protein